MEVNGEEERSRREDEEKEVYHSLLNSPCSAFHKTVQAILKCLGLESSSISPSSSSSSSSSSSPPSVEEEDPGTEIVSSLCSKSGLLLNIISKPIRAEGSRKVRETGFMAMVTRLVRRRRPRPPYSSGQPGQIN